MSDILRKDRINWVDAARGITIIFVLLAHYPLEFAGRPAYFALGFSVQMFFFISGCLFMQKNISVFDYAKKQFFRLLVPYGIFALLNTAVYGLFNRSLGVKAIINILFDFVIAKRNSLICAPMWFLPCLFFVSVLYKILKDILKKNLYIIPVCFIISAVFKMFFEEPILPWSINHGLKYLIYFALGNAIFPYIKNIDIKTFSKNKTVFTVTTVFSAYGILLYFQKPLFSPSSLPLICLTVFINALCCISLNVLISVVLSSFAPLREIGKNTLGFCCGESISRAVLNTLFVFSPFKIAAVSPATTLIYNFLAMAVSYFIIILPFNRFFPAAMGKRRSNSFNNISLTITKYPDTFCVGVFLLFIFSAVFCIIAL